VTDFDKDHVREILAGHGSWFGAFLLRTIALGNGADRKKLSEPFPEEVSAVEAVETSAGGGGPEFDMLLILLWAKADVNNKAKLLKAFPKLSLGEVR